MKHSKKPNLSLVILNMRQPLERRTAENLVSRRKAGREELSARHKKVSRKVFGKALNPHDSAARIIADVRKRGLSAVLRYTKLLDGVRLTKKNVAVEPREISEAVGDLAPSIRRAMEESIQRVAKFHKRGLPKSWVEKVPGGGYLGERVVPLAIVGATIPAQAAPLPSSVIMTAVPARVAGVEKVVVVTAPGPGGRVHPSILAACGLCGVDTVYRVGGAQALAALALGVAPFPKVDKIVGPGNAFVAAAKGILQGEVGIDGLQGPSEVLILTDGSVPADFAASDLLAQAEHDEMAFPVLITWSKEFAGKVQKAVHERLDDLPRRDIARRALSRGAIIVTLNRGEAFRMANRIAPEHMSLATRNPEEDLAMVKNAGALFLGEFTPEACADYAAGPNHVLPTSGTARFASPLSARDFVKTTNVLSLRPGSLERLSNTVTALARLEGLEAHARSVEVRLRKNQGKSRK